ALLSLCFLLFKYMNQIFSERAVAAIDSIMRRIAVPDRELLDDSIALVDSPPGAKRRCGGPRPARRVCPAAGRGRGPAFGAETRSACLRRLPKVAAAAGRRRRRIPGHVPGANQACRYAQSARAAGELAAWGRDPHRAQPPQPCHPPAAARRI